MILNMSVKEILDKLNIKYICVNHNPVYTVSDALYIHTLIKGVGVKNIFLKSKNNFYLVAVEESKRIDIKHLAKLLNVSHLTFASPEDLESILKVKSGAVSILNIINDIDNRVIILLDKELEDKILLMHPNVNSKTISISYNDLIKFINYMNHKYIIF